MVYNAVTKTCSLALGKVDKYIYRIDALLGNDGCTSKVEKLDGNSVWASYVEP